MTGEKPIYPSDVARGAWLAGAAAIVFAGAALYWQWPWALRVLDLATR